jgi:hypothetical protein
MWASKLRFDPSLAGNAKAAPQFDLCPHVFLLPTQSSLLFLSFHRMTFVGQRNEPTA